VDGQLGFVPEQVIERAPFDVMMSTMFLQV
jgi:hypothetical protein